MEVTAQVGIFGGSGFYEFLDNVKEVWVETPYGSPSDKIALAKVGGTQVAFLPRHGKDHRLPPHQINYRANLWAMKQLGVTRIIAPYAAGSLQPNLQPGDFVVCDQFVNRTWGRADTFYDGPIVTHIGAADPYCRQLRELLVAKAEADNIRVHRGGTVVVIQGPRYSTRAESQEYHERGWSVINMTQYPEAILARELEICYAGIALITDFDAGIASQLPVAPVSHQEVVRVFQANQDKLRSLLTKVIMALPAEQECDCGRALAEARH